MQQQHRQQLQRPNRHWQPYRVKRPSRRLGTFPEIQAAPLDDLSIHLKVYGLSISLGLAVRLITSRNQPRSPGVKCAS